MAKRQLRGKELKEFRSKVSKLKQMGLVSKKVDARKQKSTRYMRDIVEKTFKPVLEGRAVAVKVPSRKIAKEYGSGFKTRGKKVVVPIEKGNIQKPHWAPKQKQIIGKARENGKIVDQIFAPFNMAPRLSGVQYAMPFAHGMVIRKPTKDALEEFMHPYEFPPPGSKRRPFKNWRDFVVIEKIDEGTSDDDEGETVYE